MADGKVGFGHTRLSIIDLSSAGSQPMVDDATGVVLTFNGEIYNFRELRSELRQKGHEFKSSSDTEVVLRAYLEFGTEMFSRLNGIFALAIWDPRVDEVVICRDHFGVKPLYVSKLTASSASLVKLRDCLRSWLASGLILVHWRFIHLLFGHLVGTLIYGSVSWIQVVFAFHPAVAKPIGGSVSIVGIRRLCPFNTRQDLTETEAIADYEITYMAVHRQMAADVPGWARFCLGVWIQVPLLPKHESLTQISSALQSTQGLGAVRGLQMICRMPKKLLNI